MKHLKKEYKFIDKRGDYYIYENEDYKKMGISYNYYISDDDYEKLSYKERREILNKALVLNEEQIKIYNSILQKYNEDETKYTNETENYYFKFGKGSFTNEFEIAKSTMIMYSVPYDCGWSVKINGKRAKIEKVDDGLMAINVNKGKNKVEFKYTPPGLKIGTVVYIISLIIVLGKIILKKFTKQ